GIAIIIFSLIFIQPDLGTAVIFLGIVATLFFISPVHKKIKNQTFLAALMLIVFGALILTNSGAKIFQDRQLERLNFKNPCSRLLSTGDQVCNGYIAINNGGLGGVGLGNSTQKYLYLSEPYTDFIFAIIVEELGFIIGAVIIILEGLVLWRIIKIGKNSYTNRGALMCYGICVYIFLHIIINLGGLLGLIPLTGVPLPFMSYGGSFTLCLMISIAIVERVAVETGIRNEVKSSDNSSRKKLKK
ncbi:MAG: FtsW/RodA/SpoVE family cell cycle protein, partial [Bacilli bacterium]